ncbi:amino acid ABC transporter permease [Alginatibacterium sediminis]|uniref:Putative glutamine transport system permease protein GlnP n=1 Tax=Alginatibacterium sediminis TaxID=2164068 RepID=A0A420EHL5_9ALTE|nr:amino acid ABC transporter permease [Alginatibacterium sediminis]RKF20189.1 amino acid ABC transporter permease [Alginatibacterium sediminis]
MQSQPRTLFWNLVFVAIMGAIISSIYFSSDRIDYNWNWSRVLPYIVNTDPAQVSAPQDGTVIENARGELVFVNDAGDELIQLAEYDQVLVFVGDLLFEGDRLASSDGWRIGPLTHGLIVTIQISLMSLLFAIVLGVLFGLMRISHNPALKNLAITYIELIRGTPLLVQIFIVYFFIGTVLDLERFTAGVVALSVFTGAYVAEIVRAGIQSIAKGQMEAARSLGMNYFQAMVYVVMPQAFKRVLPPLAGQFINLIKDSSLVSVISITDLTKAGREVVSGSFAPFEVWFTVALMYLLLTSSLSWAIQRLEKRLAASD